MGANGLAFRPWRTFARATVELGEHGLIRYRRGVHIADVRLAHRRFLQAFRACVLLSLTVYYRELLKAVFQRLPQLLTGRRLILPVFMGFAARRGAQKIIAQIL